MSAGHSDDVVPIPSLGVLGPPGGVLAAGVAGSPQARPASRRRNSSMTISVAMPWRSAAFE